MALRSNFYYNCIEISTENEQIYQEKRRPISRMAEHKDGRREKHVVSMMDRCEGGKGAW